MVDQVGDEHLLSVCETCVGQCHPADSTVLPSAECDDNVGSARGQQVAEWWCGYCVMYVLQSVPVRPPPCFQLIFLLLNVVVNSNFEWFLARKMPTAASNPAAIALLQELPAAAKRHCRVRQGTYSTIEAQMRYILSTARFCFDRDLPYHLSCH